MKIEDTKENSAKCICGQCPTHNECMKKNMLYLFCARGKTACILDKKGCICGGCSIANEYKLLNRYFCENGEAK